MSVTPQLPPPPSPPNSVTRSDLLPLFSRRTRLFRSRILLPVVAVTLVSVLLFWLPSVARVYEDFLWIYVATAAVILLTFFYFVYVYSGETESSLRYWTIGLVTFLQCVYVYWPVYAPVFRRTLALGDPSTYTADFARMYLNFFIAAGLCEELLKAVPILICLLVALRVPRRPGGVADWFALKGPLDGLLMGVFSGAVFTMWETLGGYLMNAIGEAKSLPLGYLSGMFLMLPRLLDSFGGHVGYSGIFGYFIGLAALHPRKAARLVVFGWVVASALHALWNTVPDFLTTWSLMFAGALTAIIFVACLLKARQLDAPRLAMASGQGSILAMPPLPSSPGLSRSAGLSEVATFLERSIGVEARAASPEAAEAIPASGVSIGTGALRYALAPGGRMDFPALFPAAGIPPGHAAILEAAPDGSLVLRNTGRATWAAFRPDGAGSTIPPGGSIGAEAGMRIVLGTASLDLAAY